MGADCNRCVDQRLGHEQVPAVANVVVVDEHRIKLVVEDISQVVEQEPLARVLILVSVQIETNNPRPCGEALQPLAI